MRTSLFAIALASPSVALAAPGPTSAQAEALFQEGIALVDQGQPALGCPKLEESERLESQVGTEFRLADCYERIGRTASAWALFVQVQGKVETKEEIEKAKGRVDALAPKLTRLRILVPDAVASLVELEVQRDGVLVGRASFGAAAPVDPGPHTIRVTAKGKAPWERHVTADGPGATVDVSVPELEASTEGSAGGWGMHPRRVAGFAIGGAGLLGLAIGGVLAGVAASTWSDAEALCPAKKGCSEEAHAESLTALSLADGATAMFVIGGALAATGIVLAAIPTSQGSAERAAVWIAPTFGGALLKGTF
ncbi:MAG: hypothetical protein U0414_26550 [Polyangiaceae bacterium]